MTNSPTILAIDNGTQSVRALIFDTQGNLLAKSRVSVPVYASEQPGWSELDPELFWQTVCQACQNLWQMEGVVREDLVGVAVTTQRSTVINLDKDGIPLRPAMTWMDNRRTFGLKKVGGVWGLLFAVAGMTETVAYLQAEAECNWIRTQQPEIWGKTHKFIQLSGYLTYRLTERLADSIGCQVAYIPFDYKSQRWAAKSDWKWQAVPMPESFLPELVAPTETIGQISKRASEQTGIPAGLPMVAAAADKACEVIGAGCLEPNIACISYGTSATINTTHTKYAEVIPLIPPYPSAVPNAYSMEIQIYRGYWMVSWFKQEFGALEERIATERGMAAEAVFEESVRQIPPGSLGLVLQPYWSPGLKIPGPEAKGAVIGFGDIHQRAHLYRAIQEGLAYALRDGAERTEKSSRVKISEIRVAGGGSQSDVAMQLTADIFGLQAAKPHVYEASGLGAAIDAAVGLKLHPDFSSAIRIMTRIGRVFEPNPQAHEIYDALYTKVYSKMYSRLKPLYEDIRKITGYPPGY